MSKLLKADAPKTLSEIAGQPDVWRDWAWTLPTVAVEIRAWIDTCDPAEIWLCGAGTSAFIGDVLHRVIERPGCTVKSIPSTDLVASPQMFFAQCKTPLVVSFGRSGNSSETLGTLDLLDKHAPNAFRLNITCNRDSALANCKPTDPGRQREIILPEASHDQGFAMTASFTTMLMTALACLSDLPPADIATRLAKLSDGAEVFLNRKWNVPRPARAVFLGSGPHQGTAREAALKVLELTAGQVVTCWDSTLGFRHGPKAVVDDQTMIFVFLSDQLPTRRYDDDVVAEIRNQYPGATVVSIGAPHPGGAVPDLTLGGVGDDAWNAALYILPAQVAAVNWSQDLGLEVDNPFTSGNLTRVVSHVQLYV